MPSRQLVFIRGGNELTRKAASRCLEMGLGCLVWYAPLRRPSQSRTFSWARNIFIEEFMSVGGFVVDRAEATRECVAYPLRPDEVAVHEDWFYVRPGPGSRIS